MIIDGEVERPFNLTYAQVKELATDSTKQTLDCTGGWYSVQEWTAVNLARLLEMAGVKETALSVTIETVSGYGRGL